MPMQNERIDAVQAGNFPICVTVGGCLNGFARRAVRRVKSLFTENHSAGLSLVQQLRSSQIFGEHLKVFECDPRRFRVR